MIKEKRDYLIKCFLFGYLSLVVVCMAALFCMMYKIDSRIVDMESEAPNVNIEFFYSGDEVPYEA